MTDWQALDDRIARMMGFEQELQDEDDLFWVSSDGNEFFVDQPSVHVWTDWDVWHPHADLRQAMMALKAVAKRGYDVDLKIWDSGWTYRVWIQPPSPWAADHEECPKAICLAIKEFLDAQDRAKGTKSG